MPPFFPSSFGDSLSSRLRVWGYGDLSLILSEFFFITLMYARGMFRFSARTALCLGPSLLPSFYGMLRITGGFFFGFVWDTSRRVLRWVIGFGVVMRLTPAGLFFLPLLGSDEDNE